MGAGDACGVLFSAMIADSTLDADKTLGASPCSVSTGVGGGFTGAALGDDEVTAPVADTEADAEGEEGCGVAVLVLCCELAQPANPSTHSMLTSASKPKEVVRSMLGL
jgi:hypothetical protein